MLTYFFIFGVVLQQKFNPGDKPVDYVLYFLAGMLPWLAFSEAVGRAPTILIEYRNFIKKLCVRERGNFRAEVWVWRHVSKRGPVNHRSDI